LDDDQGGVTFLKDNFVEVESFDPDLVKIIKELNKEFDDWAYKKHNKLIETESMPQSILYQQAQNTDLDSLSDEALQLFLDKSNLNLNLKSKEFYRELLECDLLNQSKSSKPLIPTGNAILLFGKNPRYKFPQAGVKAKVNYGNNQSDTASFDDALVLIPDKVEAWVKKVIPESFDRSTFTRNKIPHFPPEVIREAIINAIVHRDYSIDGAKVQLEIYPDRIVVKSPGLPVPPNTLEKLQNFTATSYSRNKKLALIFNKIGFMEESEIGMDTYRDMRNRYKLPLPIITYEEPNLIVTFPRTADAVRDLDKTNVLSNLNDEELAGLDWIKLKGETTSKDYADHFSFSEKKAQRHLAILKENGFVILLGRGPAAIYKYVAYDNE
jgi:ATP-dependent DNA helicase RecG